MNFIFFFFPCVTVRDNERIWKIQRKYKSGDKEAIKDLFQAIKECAKRFVFYERRKKGFFMDKETVNEKAIDATTYILEQFIKRPDFELKLPSAYIRLRVLAALYRHKKIDEITVYTDEDY